MTLNGYPSRQRILSLSIPFRLLLARYPKEQSTLLCKYCVNWSFYVLFVLQPKNWLKNRFFFKDNGMKKKISTGIVVAGTVLLASFVPHTSAADAWGESYAIDCKGAVGGDWAERADTLIDAFDHAGRCVVEGGTPTIYINGAF